MGQKHVIPSTKGGAGYVLKFSGIAGGVMSGTNTITSETYDCKNLDNIGLQVAWTGTPTGTLSVLGSIDNVNFIALTFNPALTQPAGSAGSELINLNQFPFPYLQVQYVNASGSGTLTTFVSGKDLN